MLQVPSSAYMLYELISLAVKRHAYSINSAGTDKDKALRTSRCPPQTEVGTMTIAQVNTILVGASKMVAMTAACVGGVSVRALLCARGLVERRPKRDR